MTFEPVLRSQADVEQAWRELIHPLGWPARRLYFLLVDDDGRPVPRIAQIDGVPDVLEPATTAGLAETWRAALDEFAPHGRIAVLLCRPGVGPPTDVDQAAAAVVYEAGRAAGVPLEVIHLATDVDIVPLPLDALGRESA